MASVAFHTLGCKVNQYDTQAMLELFRARGWDIVDFDRAADVYVINTCTVTGTGDKKSLNTVRRCQRLNPEAHVVICGCLAQRDGEKLLETGARLVIGNARRGEVVDLLEEAVRENRQICAVGDIRRAAYEPLRISADEGKTRAVIKIQEGCDRFCTYCIIPYVRGGIRSRLPRDIHEEALRLAANGYRELVLTGIHLTSYGRDLENCSLLDAVLACDVDGVERIRLGSLEPVIATEEFAGKLAQISKVCPQFHLALQSGSDAVLQRMRRRYTTKEFARSCDALRKFFPDCALTTDVICGFPGETEEEFEQTMAFCKKIGFARLHVFPYSARKGTKAADMPGQIPKALREERARRLIALGKETAKEYAGRLLHTVQPVLFEEMHEGICSGYTPQYMTVQAKGNLQGQILPVLLESLDENGFIGRICPERTIE